MSQHSANCHKKEQTEAYLPFAYPKSRSLSRSFILPTDTHLLSTYYGLGAMLGPGNLVMEQFNHGPCSCEVYSQEKEKFIHKGGGREIIKETLIIFKL